MKRWMIIAMAILGAALTGCSKEMADSQSINGILQEERYVKVTLGESYHQEEVEFDMGNDRAVVPKSAEWGLQKYRDGEETGVNYGGDGVDIYESDKEMDPELYAGYYLDSIRALKLTVKDVRDSDYSVKIVKKSRLDLFEEELATLSGMVVNDAYRLAGVEIEFDKSFRPVKKTFQLEKKDSTKLENQEEDSEECTQEFSYNVGKMRFDWAFNNVKKSIEKEY